MADMIERVARAIDPGVWENWDNWIALKGYSEAEASEEFARSPSLHKSLARATDAIQAMREPTEQMATHAAANAKYVPSDAHRRVLAAGYARVYTDMIDAAIVPTPPVQS